MEKSALIEQIINDEVILDQISNDEQLLGILTEERIKDIGIDRIRALFQNSVLLEAMSKDEKIREELLKKEERIEGRKLNLAAFASELVEKYKYTEELAFNLAILAEDIIDYFGLEYASVVLDAIRETKVVLGGNYNKNGIKETVGDIIKREGMAEEIKGEKRIGTADSRSVESAYCEKLHISYENGNYNVDAVDKMIVINNRFVSDDPYSLGVLLGELLKAVSSQFGTYKIDKDVLTINRGLSTRSEKLSQKSGVVSRQFVSERGIGLEDSINNYDQVYIIRSNHGETYDSKDYLISNLAASCVMDILNMRDTVRVGQITKDSTALANSCSMQGYQNFVGVFDTLRDLEKKRNGSAEANEALEDYYRTSVAPMIVAMRKSLKATSYENNTAVKL